MFFVFFCIHRPPLVLALPNPCACLLGLHILDVAQAWEKLMLAARVIVAVRVLKFVCAAHRRVPCDEVSLVCCPRPRSSLPDRH